jgi:hypothetical protein
MTVIIKSTEDKVKIEQTLKDLKRSGKLDSFKHCGGITLKENPMSIQKSMRDEW